MGPRSREMIFTMGRQMRRNFSNKPIQWMKGAFQQAGSAKVKWVFQGLAWARLRKKKEDYPPPTYTLERKKGKSNTHARMQRCGSKLKIFPCEECRNWKKHHTPIKLESKKQAKKVVTEKVGGGKFPSISRI